MTGNYQMCFNITPSCCSVVRLFKLRPCVLSTVSSASDSSSATSLREESDSIRESVVGLVSTGIAMFLMMSNTEENAHIHTVTLVFICRVVVHHN